MTIRPERSGIGSGGYAVAEAANLRHFPTMPQLVLNEEKYTNLLAELLPVLDKYGCLESPIWRTKNRSPWARAYCDLYHPSGPWGSNKFKNVPAMENKNARYSFKRYRIQKIYDTLANSYKGDSAVHKDLYDKLREFKAKEKYYNDYMDACKEIVRKEIMKPAERRAPIPTSTTELIAVAANTTANANANTVATATASGSSQDQSDDSTSQTNVVVNDHQTPSAQKTCSTVVGPRTRASSRKEAALGTKADKNQDQSDENRAQKHVRLGLDRGRGHRYAVKLLWVGRPIKKQKGTEIC